MRLLLILLSALMVIPLCGVTIFDGTEDGSMPLRRQAMGLALANKWKLSCKSVSAQEAVQALKQGRADAIVLDKKNIPNDFPFEKRPFAILAAAVYVNSNNTCTGLSRQELTELLSSARPSWKSITGNRVDIHFYGLSSQAQGYGLFSRLLLSGDFQIKAPVFRSSSTNNVIQLCAGNPVAMGFALFSPRGNEMTRAIAIDGISPTFENLANGKYPLTITHVLLFPAEKKPEIQKLLDSFKTPGFLGLLDRSNMLPQ